MSADPRLLRAIRHAEARMVDPEADLSLERLARVAAMSPYHFARTFRAACGEAPAAWVRRVRLERAASLLRHSDWPVGRIGLAAGYATQAAFTRAFARQFGVPPAAWRSERGVVPWLLPPGSRSVLRRGEVDTVEVPARRLVVVRHVGPLDQAIVALGAVCAAGEALGVGADDWLVLVFLDDDDVVDPERSRVDIGWETAAPAPEGFAERTLPAGGHAVLALAGTIEESVERATQFLYAQLPASGLQPSAFETVVEIPASLAWRARDDLAAAVGGVWIGRLLHPVGAPGALLRG